MQCHPDAVHQTVVKSERNCCEKSLKQLFYIKKQIYIKEYPEWENNEKVKEGSIWSVKKAPEIWSYISF